MDWLEQQGLDARDATRMRVLKCIRANREISRTDIARALESSPATVTSACGGLLEAGLICEVERAPSGTVQRGRPRVMLQINGAAFLIAGMKISRHAILVVIADFTGDEIGTFAAPLSVSRMPARELVPAVRAALVCGLATAVNRYRVDRRSGLGDARLCEWTDWFHALVVLGT